MVKKSNKSCSSNIADLFQELFNILKKAFRLLQCGKMPTLSGYALVSKIYARTVRNR